MNMEELENTTSVEILMESHMFGAILWIPRVDGSFVMSGNVMSVTNSKMHTHTPNTHNTCSHPTYRHTYTLTYIELKK